MTTCRHVILGLCLALLLVGCTEQPAYDQGTLVVGRNVAVEDVQRAADYWNDRGAMWVVSETCDWEPCVPVYYGEICPGGEPMAACMLWDGADGLRIVLESETYDGIMDPALMIAHEVGHVMGLGHTPNSVMAESDRQGFNWRDP